MFKVGDRLTANNGNGVTIEIYSMNNPLCEFRYVEQNDYTGHVTASIQNIERQFKLLINSKINSIWRNLNDA